MSRILSIEFKNDKVNIIEGFKKGDTAFALKSISLELPQNSVAEGKILDMIIVQELIYKTLKSNSIKTKDTIFLINSNRVISRKIELPYLNNKNEIKSMIYHNIEDIFPLNISEFVFIYEVLGVFENNGVKYAKYIVHGLPTDVYNQYIDLSKKLKLNLRALDISSNMLECIAENNLNINGKQYHKESINAFIGIDKKCVSISIVNKGINDFHRIYYLNNQHTEVDKDLTDVNQWAEIIMKYFKYYYSINKSKEIISKLYIYGEEICPDVDKQLSKYLEMEVVMIGTLSNIIFSQDNQATANYLSCLLALFSNNHNNFLTHDHKYQKLKFNVSIIIIILSIALFIIFKSINNLHKSISMEDEIATMKLFVENFENKEINKHVDETKIHIEKLEGYLKGAEHAIYEIMNNDCIKSNLLEEVRNAIPDGTIVKSVYIDNYNIVLICNSDGMDEISMFLNKLRNIDYINNIHIPSVDFESKTYSYQILCNVMVEEDEME